MPNGSQNFDPERFVCESYAPRGANGPGGLEIPLYRRRCLRRQFDRRHLQQREDLDYPVRQYGPRSR